MSKLPRLRGKKLIALLKRADFDVIRIRGSHHFLQHPDGRRTVIPIHAGEHIGPGLFLKILADCEITRDEFERML
ncbi:MAG: type II toxin-antitoxin system HicA family toxin [Thermoguttaceae bacterium]|jgi:predicted RNA binding protein YcfA (HicA-like mRNA interferase family)